MKRPEIATSTYVIQLYYNYYYSCYIDEYYLHTPVSSKFQNTTPLLVESAARKREE
jgi:hypothetical protein